MAANANVCDRAGTLKPRPVPYTKLYKDMKTMENNSPPTGANIMLWAGANVSKLHEPHGLEGSGCADGRAAFKLVWRIDSSASEQVVQDQTKMTVE
jgi:hypothetical protein